MVLALIELKISAPVMRGVVKARQARKNVEVCVAGDLLLLKSHLFYRIRTWFVVRFFYTFPNNNKAPRFPRKNDVQVNRAGLALVGAGPRV